MRPVLPLWIGLVGQAQIILIDQRCRLQCVIRPLSAQIMMRDPPQFLVNQWRQFRQGSIVPLTPLNKEVRYSLLTDRSRVHSPPRISLYHLATISAPAKGLREKSRFK